MHHPNHKTVLITGASSGIGLALAKLFAYDGYSVSILARRKDRLEKIAKELNESGSTVFPITCDVTDPNDVQQAIKQTVDRFGHIDLVVLNAGVSQSNFASEFDVSTQDEVLKPNLYGALHILEKIIPHMIERQKGHIVGISSLASYISAPGSAAYSASKAALNHYLSSLRIELNDKGIDVSTICPGFIKTPLTSRNTYSMPFLMDLDTGAKKIYNAILKKKTVYNFPKPLFWLIQLSSLIPIRLRDWVLNKKPQNKSNTPIHNWDSF